MSDQFPDRLLDILTEANRNLYRKLAEAGYVVAPGATVQFVPDPATNSFVLEVDAVVDPAISESFGCGPYS